ncbi:MAG: hypothetical protein LBK65_02410 [Tannerellaceae bacterium]|nr:hypothetical protein [Tannerellaceae bacterium]
MKSVHRNGPDFHHPCAGIVLTGHSVRAGVAVVRSGQPYGLTGGMMPQARSAAGATSGRDSPLVMQATSVSPHRQQAFLSLAHADIINITINIHDHNSNIIDINSKITNIKTSIHN